MRERLRTLAVGFVVVALCGCQGAATNTRAGIRSATIAVFSETKGFDPTIVDAGSGGGDRALAVFDTLLTVDGQGGFQPRLASSMSSPDGGSTWTMRLRDGIKFSDGTALDAEAVKFNIDRALRPESTSTSKGYLAALTSVEVVDPLTLRLSLESPQPSFPLVFTESATAGFIGSPTAIEKDPAGFNANPVGAGAFVLKEWVRDDKVVLERNPDYWRRGYPLLDELTYLVLTDPQARVDALRAGTVDFSYLLPASAVAELTGDSRFEVLSGGSPGGLGIALNMEKAPGNDIRVRKAVRLAFDPATTNNVFFGAAGIWDGNVDCLPFSTEGVECLAGDAPEQDVAESRRLVAEYVADGGSAALELIGTPNYRTQLEYIQQTLDSIGLEVELTTPPTAEWVTRISEGTYQGTIMVTLPFTSFYPATYFLLSENGRNYPKQHLPEFEQAMQKGINGTVNVQVDGWHAMQRIFDREYIATWLSPFTESWVLNRETFELEEYVGGLRFNSATMTAK